MIDLLEQSLNDFGRLMGLNNLSWEPTNLTMLRFERSGTLGFQLGKQAVQLSLARSYPFVTAAQVTTALALCHWRNQFPYQVRTGLAPDKSLLFVTELQHPEFVVSNIHRAFELLCRLHDQVLAE